MFQLGVAVFIIGSFFCGLASSMVLLIAFRAVQGLGGGALTVTSTALIADVPAVREWGVGHRVRAADAADGARPAGHRAGQRRGGEPEQNTVAYSDLGTATSGVTFFRTLGGSFGASIMGSIYANQLQGRLATALATAKVPPSAVSS